MVLITNTVKTLLPFPLAVKNIYTYFPSNKRFKRNNDLAQMTLLFNSKSEVTLIIETLPMLDI